MTTALEATARISDEEWRQMLAVHLDGTFYGTRAAARSMADRGGFIVNMASICGIEGPAWATPTTRRRRAASSPSPAPSPNELIQQGIRVNAIAPGFVTV